jgi:hypothetical protein
MAVGEVGGWSLGPLEVLVARHRHEWAIAWWCPRDPLADLAVKHQATWAPPATAQAVRFVGADTDEALRIMPMLADRDVVVRPEQAVQVPAGAEAELFVSTPVWVGFSVGSERPLTEIPSWRPSDTWFGANTRSGELCYSGRTRARVELDQIMKRPTRAITSVRLRNRAAAPLHLERIKIPVRHLSLFAGEQGLWTESITLTSETEQPAVELGIDEGPPQAAGGALAISPPRLDGSPNILRRALGALVGDFL